MRTPYRILPAVAALLLGASAAFAQEGSSAYDDLDASQLAVRLSALKMTELMDAFQEGQGGGAGLQAQTILLQAKREEFAGTADPAAKAELINQITALYRNVIDLATKDIAAQKERRDKNKATMVAFKLRMEFGDFLGSRVVDSNVMNMLMLRDGPNDAAFIIQKTAEGVKVLDDLNRDIDDTIQSWRGDPISRVTRLSELEDLKRYVAYCSGWIYFNRGVALRGVAEKVKEREGLLRDAIVQANPFADGSDDSGVKHHALLLRGMALRELGEYPAASTSLKAAAACPDTAELKDVRWKAQFHLTRLAIESGDKQAKKAVEDFCKFAVQVFGEDQQMVVDLLESMLLNYMYERNAAAAKDPKIALEGKKALLAWVNKYSEPDAVREWAWIMTNRFGAKPDIAKADAALLLAAGVKALLDNDGETGLAMLEKVLAGSDDLSVSARALALWYVGLAENERKETGKAAGKFKELAEKYPKHSKAPDSARYAVISYKQVVGERRRNSQQVSPLLQAEYIGSLEHLLTNFLDKHPDNVQYYLDLAIEYQLRSRRAEAGPARADLRKKAIASFDKVPKDDMGVHMYARATSLELRYMLWAEDLGTADKAGFGVNLVKDLQDYAKDAVEAMPQAKEERVKRDIKEAGARCELHSGQILFATEATQTRASDVLQSIPQKWPGTVAEGEAIEFLISQFITIGKTDKAVALLEDFRKKHPERAEHLIQMVIQQIQSRIDGLRLKRDGTLELNRFRGIFYNFTKDLFDRVKEQAVEKRYGTSQLYGSGLIEKGYAVRDGDRKADEAKKLFEEGLQIYEECEKHDSSKRDAEAKKVEAAFVEHSKNILDPVVDAATAEKALKAYLALLAELKVDVERSAGPVEIGNAIKFLALAKTEAEKKARLEKVRFRIKEQLDQLKDGQLRSLPIDAENLPGLARCHRALGNFSKAAEYYKKTVDGLEYYRTQPEGPDKDRLRKMWLRLFLEQCENALEGFKGNPPAMQGLVRTIRLARQAEPAMEDPALAPRFAAVETEADDAAKAAPAAKPAPAEKK